MRSALLDPPPGGVDVVGEDLDVGEVPSDAASWRISREATTTFRWPTSVAKGAVQPVQVAVRSTVSSSMRTNRRKPQRTSCSATNMPIPPVPTIATLSEPAAAVSPGEEPTSGPVRRGRVPGSR